MNHETEYRKEVARLLRRYYGVSWTAGVKAFGETNIHDHYRVSVFASTLAWRIYKAVHPNGKK